MDLQLNAEFCPKCFYPLESSDDMSRLCLACQWFGDQSEICTKPPTATSLELAFMQLLSLYRGLCRCELMAEQIVATCPEHKKTLTNIRHRIHQATHSFSTILQDLQK